MRQVLTISQLLFVPELKLIEFEYSARAPTRDGPVWAPTRARANGARAPHAVGGTVGANMTDLPCLNII